jgi:hypothetical protein
MLDLDDPPCDPKALEELKNVETPKEIALGNLISARKIEFYLYFQIINFYFRTSAHH